MTHYKYEYHNKDKDLAERQLGLHTVYSSKNNNLMKKEKKNKQNDVISFFFFYVFQFYVCFSFDHFRFKH